MQQVPIEILNAIQPRSRWGKAFLPMNQSDLDRALQKQAEAMSAAGYTNKVILAYQTVLFLLMERDAVTELIRRTQRPDLRQVMPEVLGRDEAVTLMQREYRLTPKQAGSLRKILPSNPLTDPAREVLGMWRHGASLTEA